MKKILVFMAVSTIGGFALTSCNKDYDCVCRLNGAETSRSSVRASNKNSAEDDCNKKQSALGATYQCAIE
jgi:hypothetical protein